MELRSFGTDAQILRNMQDAFHTPVQVLDGEGKLLNLYQYDEFGRLTKKREAYELPFGYTGYRKEAAQNLYFAGAREYNGESGSFLTKDLWRYLKAEDPSTANLYLYGKGNPLKYMDFGGHEAVVEKSYLERTLDCALLSGFTGKVTLLGLGIRIGAGAAGVDAPLDVLDLLSDLTVNYNPEASSWWLTTLVDAVSVLPMVGVIKYLDEAGILAKTVAKSLKALFKNSDEIVDEAKEINRLMEAMDAAGGIGMRNGDMILKEAQDLTGNSAWRTGGEAIMEGARRLDGISGMADEAKPLWNGIEK